MLDRAARHAARRALRESLGEALRESQILLLVFSSKSNHSAQVMREVESAVDKGIPILPFRVEDVTPSASLDYFVKAIHWLDAITPPLNNHLQSLAETVRMLLTRQRLAASRTALSEEAAPATGTVRREGGPETARSAKEGEMTKPPTVPNEPRASGSPYDQPSNGAATGGDMSFVEWYSVKFNWLVTLPMPWRRFCQYLLWVVYGFIWIPLLYAISDKSRIGGQPSPTNKRRV